MTTNTTCLQVKERHFDYLSWIMYSLFSACDTTTDESSKDVAIPSIKGILCMEGLSFATLSLGNSQHSIWLDSCFSFVSHLIDYVPRDRHLWQICWLFVHSSDFDSSHGKILKEDYKVSCLNTMVCYVWLKIFISRIIWFTKPNTGCLHPSSSSQLSWLRLWDWRGSKLKPSFKIMSSVTTLNSPQHSTVKLHVLACLTLLFCEGRK